MTFLVLFVGGIGFDPAAEKMLSYKVSSYVERPKEDDIALTVAFGRLDDGTSYPQEQGG